MAKVVQIRPQSGPQEAFLSSPADVVFYGGAAGGGKTFALILEPLRHINNPKFNAVIFRRTTKQVIAQGGLMDESNNIYPYLKAKLNKTDLKWSFRGGASIGFAHLEHEKSVHNWQGSQIPLICFDELSHFTRKQFLYMFSRNRSTSGVKPYVRCTYNPVPPDDPIGGWIHEFVGWYLDDEGYPDPDKSGVIRWFVNVSDTLYWYSTKAEAVANHPTIAPKSFTYIASSVYDNKILLEKDPAYLANLHALSLIDQERLLRGNHLIRAEAGKVFNRAWFEIVDEIPKGNHITYRFWDLAATERKGKKGAATAGVKMTMVNGVFYVLDCIEEAFSPAKTDALLMATASADTRSVRVRWEKEGGSAGKRDAAYIARLMAGYDARGIRPSGDKLTRSRALAAQAYNGNVKLLRGAWNERWLSHMHMIPDGERWDIHDASAGAFNELAKTARTRRATSRSAF